MNSGIDTSYYTKFRSSKLRVTRQAGHIYYMGDYMYILGEEVVHYLMQPSDTLERSLLEIHSTLHLPPKSRFSQI